MRDFKELKIWKNAQDVTVLIYQLTRVFPQNEQFGITSQIRRAAVSISSNIAEGSGRLSQVEFIRFLEIAFASAAEVESLLLLSQRLEFGNPDSMKSLMVQLIELKRMVNSLIQKIKKESNLS